MVGGSGGARRGVSGLHARGPWNAVAGALLSIGALLIISSCDPGSGTDESSSNGGRPARGPCFDGQGYRIDGDRFCGSACECCTRCTHGGRIEKDGVQYECVGDCFSRMLSDGAVARV